MQRSSYASVNVAVTRSQLALKVASKPSSKLCAVYGFSLQPRRLFSNRSVVIRTKQVPPRV